MIIMMMLMLLMFDVVVDVNDDHYDVDDHDNDDDYDSYPARLTPALFATGQLLDCSYFGGVTCAWMTTLH